ncbi:lipopolysaccharide biosynthesis protein [Modestobacter sp. SSW1-42]|uniref:lipopolysaccharide biosynthesis protein n=1 Tax=Modestobacter sp. SSW1-42 TaxID=596372 RepID=UPI0039857DC6
MRDETGSSAEAPPDPGQGADAKALGLVAVSVVGSGVFTYAYLALVARGLPTADYGWFGSYWSLALVIGFGAFLPVELELARLVSARPPGARFPAGTARTLLTLTVACLVLVALLGGVLTSSLGGQVGFLWALLAVCVVSAGQFLLRGWMLGTGRLRLHGIVLLVDSGLRVLLALVLGWSVDDASGSDYAWTLVLAISLAHLPLLLWTTRGRTAARHEDAPVEPARPFVTAVGHLLVGSLCAQALLNAAPVLITVLAAPGEEALAAQFIASYTLVRLPLFVAVPLQSALVPVLVNLGTSGDGSRLRTFLLRGLAVIGVLAVLAAAVGLWLGPPIVELVFGARYALPGGEIALLAVGSVLHLGLLVAGQALVAAGRHRQVAVVWALGLVTAAVLFAVVDDLVLRASLAFTVGSGVALAIAAVTLLVRPRDPAGTAPHAA